MYICIYVCIYSCLCSSYLYHRHRFACFHVCMYASMCGIVIFNPHAPSFQHACTYERMCLHVHNECASICTASHESVYDVECMHTYMHAYIHACMYVACCANVHVYVGYLFGATSYSLPFTPRISYDFLDFFGAVVMHVR